jgi:hypothetical protein
MRVGLEEVDGLRAEDRQLERDALDVHPVRRAREEALDVVDVDPEGLPDLVLQELGHVLLDLRERRRDRVQRPEHVGEEVAQVPDRVEQVADGVGCTCHREQVVLDVVLGGVEEDVDDSDRVLAVGTLLRRLRRLVPADPVGGVARCTRIEERAGRGETELRPLAQAGVDVIDPRLDVALDDVVDHVVGEVDRRDEAADRRALAVLEVDRRRLHAADRVDRQHLRPRVAVRIDDGAVGELGVPRGAGLLQLQARLQVEEEVDQLPAPGLRVAVRVRAAGAAVVDHAVGVVVDAVEAAPDRQGVVGVDERVVDEVVRHRERDPRRRVVRVVGIPVLVDLERDRCPVRVPVVAGRGVADVALGDQVAKGDLGVVDVGEDLPDRRKDSERMVVDERVRPHVAGRVGGVAEGKREDLLPLHGVVAGVGLSLPGALEDVLHPLPGLLGVDDRLPEHEVREAVRADDAGVVVRLLVAQGILDDLWHVVGAAVEADAAVVDHVLPGTVARVVVHERLPGERTRRCSEHEPADGDERHDQAFQDGSPPQESGTDVPLKLGAGSAGENLRTEDSRHPEGRSASR